MSQPRMSPNRQNLRYEGLSAGEPVRQPNRERRYRITFYIHVKMTKWDAKALAERFLVLEYEANWFEFFRAPENQQNRFIVEFNSFAVEGI